MNPENIHGTHKIKIENNETGFTNPKYTIYYSSNNFKTSTAAHNLPVSHDSLPFQQTVSYSQKMNQPEHHLPNSVALQQLNATLQNRRDQLNASDHMSSTSGLHQNANHYYDNLNYGDQSYKNQINANRNYGNQDYTDHDFQYSNHANYSLIHHERGNYKRANCARINSDHSSYSYKYSNQTNYTDSNIDNRKREIQEGEIFTDQNDMPFVNSSNFRNISQAYCNVNSQSNIIQENDAHFEQLNDYRQRSFHSHTQKLCQSITSQSHEIFSSPSLLVNHQCSGPFMERPFNYKVNHLKKMRNLNSDQYKHYTFEEGYSNHPTFQYKTGQKMNNVPYQYQKFYQNDSYTAYENPPVDTCNSNIFQGAHHRLQQNSLFHSSSQPFIKSEYGELQTRPVQYPVKLEREFQNYRYNNISLKPNQNFRDRHKLPWTHTRATKHHSKSHAEFSCQPCNRVFYTNASYLQHVKEEHIKCEAPDCNYSAPLAVLEAHQLQHIKTEDGCQLNESLEDTAMWLESRKKCYPTKAKIAALKKGIIIKRSREEMSILEKILRRRVYLSPSEASKRRRILQKSALVPNLHAILKRCRTWRLNTMMTKDKLLDRNDTKSNKIVRFKPSELTQDFPICIHFLKYKTCKWEQCHFSHNLNLYRQWKIQKNEGGLDIPMRPPLLYQLMLPDIKKVESLVLQAFRYIVQKLFFTNESEIELTKTSVSIEEITHASDDSASTYSVDTQQLSSCDEKSDDFLLDMF